MQSSVVRGRKPGFSPVTGWDGTLIKKNKAWSMPDPDWEWLEDQPNQSEILRQAIALYRQQFQTTAPEPKTDRRERLKNFLMDNPGWHDAYQIAEAIGSSPQNIQHLASQIKRTFPLEIRKGEGRGRRNEYRYKEN